MVKFGQFGGEGAYWAAKLHDGLTILDEDSDEAFDSFCGLI